MPVIYINVPDDLGTTAEEFADSVDRLLKERAVKRSAVIEIIRQIEKDYSRLTDLRATASVESMMKTAHESLFVIYNALRKEFLLSES